MTTGSSLVFKHWYHLSAQAWPQVAESCCELSTLIVLSQLNKPAHMQVKIPLYSTFLFFLLIILVKSLYSYLCASLRMLGLPSNKVDRLSGATMKTFDILHSHKWLHVITIIVRRRINNMTGPRIVLTFPGAQISHPQMEHWIFEQSLHTRLCHASVAILRCWPSVSNHQKQ